MKKSKKRQLIMNMLFQVVNLWQQKNTEGSEGLTLRQFMLLSSLKEIDRQKVNLSALAEAFGGSRQNVRQLVTVLARKEFIRIEQSGADKRELLVSLTEKGAACFAEGESAEDDLIRPVFAGINEKALDGTMECLESMIANLEAADESGE